MSEIKTDSPAARKGRGAYYTPLPIAQFIVDWALDRRKEALVLDPTCGGGVFLAAALKKLASSTGKCDLGSNLYGIDIFEESVERTRALLRESGSEAQLQAGDFLYESTPAQLDARIPFMDAVVGNPPFIRYQNYKGEVRRHAVAAAESQGVHLSGLTSSWAPILVHASAFLKPEGVLAFVLPAEILTVGYAEPIRRWLRSRFSSIHLVLFEDLQFSEVDEQVVILIARGSGGCNNFTIHHVRSETELKDLHPFDAASVTPPETGKWTALLLPEDVLKSFQRITSRSFCDLSTYGRPVLQTVTGSNSFFVISEAKRQSLHLRVGRDVVPVLPPGSRSLPLTEFDTSDWERLRDEGERVWLIYPDGLTPSPPLLDYITSAERLGIDQSYKTSKRTPWWRVPVVEAPDMFFTYMTATSPRLVSNTAKIPSLNSLLGLSLYSSSQSLTGPALSVLAINSVTALGAELYGRTFGGGLLKMEPSEAAVLPVPIPDMLHAAWQRLDQESVKSLLRRNKVDEARSVVNKALIVETMGTDPADLSKVVEAVDQFRRRRNGRPR